MNSVVQSSAYFGFFYYPFWLLDFITDCKKSEKHPVQSASFNHYFYHCIFKTDGNSVCVL